jgi:Fe-S cluster assembly iron-binding protein IscA
MRFRLALDEPKDYDKKVVERGITFLMDPFAAAFIEGINIDYDDIVEDDFIVTNTAGPNSSC